MCGIVGLISKSPNGFYQQDLKIFKEMLWADQLRGTDGTGVYWVDHQGNPTVVKAPTSASVFMEQMLKSQEEAIFKTAKIIIGHNRAATKGARTKDNTHPFREKNITLVHNGTLYTHKHLADTEVDSHAITHAIAGQGFNRTLKELWGAFALVWFNEQNKHLYLVRNNERPLNIIETKDLFIISSEPGLAHWIAERNNEKIVTTTDLIPGKLYSFKIDNTTVFKTKEVEFRPEYKPPLFLPPTTSNTTGTTGTTGNKRPKLDERIEFFPINISWKRGIPHLLGLYEVGEEEYDVEYEGVYKEYSKMKDMKQRVSLTGRISQIISYPVAGKTTLVVKELQFVTNNKTLNGEELTKEEISNIDECACDMCGGFCNTQYLDKMVVIKRMGILEGVYCHECSPIMKGDY